MSQNYEWSLADKEAVSPHRAKRPKVGFLIAYRNLVHDRASFLVTIIGIVFSVVLVTVQCGLYIGAERMIATVQDRLGGDLWIMAPGTQSFDDPTLLAGQEKFAALAAPGVASVKELVVDFAAWSKPGGGFTTVLVVGSDQKDAEPAVPWNVVEGDLRAITAPQAVSVDKTYLDHLGIEGVGATAEVNGARVNVVALSEGIRSFTTLPYVFTTLRHARSLLADDAPKSTYQLLTLAPDADPEVTKQLLAARLPDTEVLSAGEFRSRGLSYWMFETGAGSALITGAALGLIVGLVIVAQTLYHSTKDHFNEFATLRALGASAGYIQRIIIIQAIMSAVLGYTIGILIGLLAAWASEGTDMVIVVTPGLALAMFALTLTMCVSAAISAILKVTRIDPAGVFSR